MPSESRREVGGIPNAHAHAILAGIGNCDGPGGHLDCSIVLLRFG